MANLAQDLYTLPDGWLPCDGCGRPMPAEKMDAHLGSTACQAEQHGNKPPPGWVMMGRVDRVNASSFQNAIAARIPVFKQKPGVHDSDRRQIWFSPSWVKIISECGGSYGPVQRALKRARLDYEYRAAVLGGLRLVGKEDSIGAVNDLLDG